MTRTMLGDRLTARRQIDRMVGAVFFNSGEPLPEGCQVLFAPTGPLQEISMANGWSDVYIMLSSVFDDVQYLLEEHERRKPRKDT